MSYTQTKARQHPEGYAIDVFAGETKLATAYGATIGEAHYRATLIRQWFETEWTTA